MRVGKADGEAWLRLSEAADLLGISLNTLRRWSDAGKIGSYRSPGGHRRYRRADVEALLRRQSSARPQERGARLAALSSPAGADARFVTARPALTTLARAAAEGIGVTSCVLAAADGDGQLRVVASHASVEEHRTISPGALLTHESAPVADEVQHSRRRVVIADIGTTNVLTPTEVAACLARGEAAVLALPLANAGQFYGVMQLVEHRAARTFTSANVAFAEFIARQATSIVSSAIAGDAAPARDQTPLVTTDGVEAVGTAALLQSRWAVSADDHDVLDYLRAFRRLVGVVSANAEARVFHLRGGVLRELSLSENGRPTPKPVDAASEMAAVLADGHSRYLPKGGAFACLLPLRQGAQTVGLLELTGPSEEVLRQAVSALTPATELLTASLFAHASQAALQRRVRDLETVVQAGIDDAARLTTDEVLQSIILRLSELTGSPVADVYAVEGGTLRALISYDGGRVDPEWEGVVIPIARYPCSLQAVETGEIAIAASLDDEILGENGRFSLERWGYQSQLAMPLIAGGRVIGLVELSDYVPRDFADDLELISGLGRVAAQALDNARLFEQVERRSRILNELVDIGTFASTCRDFDTVLRHVAERLLRTLDAANCDIYQASDEGLRCVASFDRSGFDQEAVGRLLDVRTYPTIARSVTTGQVLVVSGPDDPQLTEREREVYREYGFNSEVCVPLIVNDALFGLIDIYDTRPRQYSEYLAFLRSLGMSLAGAFASTLLFEQLEHRTTVLREIVELGALAAQGGELSDLLTTIAARLRSTIGVADCDVYEREGDELRCLASVDADGADADSVGTVFEASRYPVIDLAIRTREPMVVASLDDPRVTDEERADYAEWGFKSLVSVPLTFGKEVIGVIDVFDTRARDYGEYLDFLRTVGQIIAGAIRNSRLLSELTARNGELAELVDLGHRRAGADGVTEFLRVLTERVCVIVGAAGCQVFVPDGDDYRSIYVFEDGAPSLADVGHRLDLECFSTTRRALDERRILVVSGPDENGLSECERRHYTETEWRSDILVPLLARDRLVGLLEVYDRRARDYHEHVDFLRRVGQIVAAALDNARLVERLEHANAQLGHLVDAGLEFGSTLETDVILRSVARRLCAAAQASTCDIYAIEGDTLRCLTSMQGEKEDVAFSGALYDLNDFPGVRDVIAQGRPLAVHDMLGDERISAFERDENLRFGHRAKIELPLVAGGGTVGLASIFDDEPRDFESLELLQSLAQVAANAIANARLYDALERSAERVTLVGDVSFELSSSLDLGEVLQSTANRLCSLADLPCCDVYTLGEDGDLVCVVSLVDGETDGSWQGRTFRLSEWSALRAAVERRMPLVIASPDDPLLNDEERALMEEHGETAEVIFPLISKDVVIGVLELLENRGPRDFDQDEIDTIAAVCRVAALAIDNADLVRDLQLRNRETELLNEIARATTTLELPAVAAGAVEQLRGLAPVESAALVLHHDDELETVYASGSLRGGPGDVDAARGVVDDIRRERVVFADPRTDPRPSLLHHGAEAHGGVAMIAIDAGDGTDGVLSLAVDDPGAFDAVDRRVLERVGAQLAPAISNARLYADIKRMHLGNLKALSSALNAKDYYTLGHAARVAAYMVLLGEELGWAPELLRAVEEAAYLHDIGKIGVSDRVLLKPSVLNAREWDLMRQHPVYSADILRPLFSEELTAGVRHHHERFDGAGYPDGLAGDDIPLIARAMCVVDSYDAMSFRRPYRQALPYGACREELTRCAGSQFDPVMVAAFENVLARLHAGKTAAEVAARAAAERIDVAAHATLRRPEDEGSAAYLRIAETLRAVRDEHPPTRYLTTFVRVGSTTMLVADAEEDERLRSHIGDQTFSDEEILRLFGGERMDRTVLFVDQFGVWLSGAWPIRDERGDVVAVANADMPASTGATEIDGLRSDVTQTFSAMVAEAAAHLGPVELEAITDGLTGLYNHRYLHERLDEEIERCVLQGGDLALLLIDLDDFHTFNDRYGHSAGDRALLAVARVIESSLRQVDLAARYGGEEFAVILIDTDGDGALEVAERIRNGIVATELTLGHESLSVSIGLALCPEDASHKEELLDKADWAMFLAKRRGRDQVVSFGAEHGALTPEQAVSVHVDHVPTLAAVAAARDALSKRRRAAVTHLALAVARDLALDGETMHAVVAAAAEACDGDVTEAEGEFGVARQLAAVAAAYETLVTRPPYRPLLSESEALEELRDCPAFAYDPRMAEAFERVLGRPRA